MVEGKQTEAKGLAETEEQVSDVYAAGTSDGVILLADGKTQIISSASDTIDEASSRVDVDE